MLLAKKCQYFLYLNLIKISLEIVISDFAEKKEEKRNLFDHKKNFSKSKKSHLFSKGLIHTFGQKMPFFSLFRFDQNKTRNNAF